MKILKWPAACFFFFLLLGCATPGDHAYNQGQQAFRQKDYDSAIIHLKKAIEFLPDNPEIYSKLAAAYTHGGNYGNALAAINKAIDLQTKEKMPATSAAESFALRSLIYRHKGDRQAAFRDAEKAYALNPADDPAQISLGAAHLDKGNYSAGDPIYEYLHPNGSRCPRCAHGQGCDL